MCECGPTCNCVLCIDHPYNTATMNHIATEFGQMMTETDGAGMSPPNGTNSRPDMFAQGGWRPCNNSAVPNGMLPTAFEDPIIPHHSPTRQQANDIFLNPADFQMFNFAFPLDNVNEFDAQPDFSYGAMPDLDMTGMCGGIPEGCPCGDDCACIGCLVHGKPGNIASPPNWS